MDALFSYRDELLYCHHSLTETPDPAAFPIHAHEMPEIYCFLEGCGRYLVEGTLYPLAPGDVLLMRPAETHKLILEEVRPYRRMAIHFSPALLKELDGEGRLLRPFFDRPLGQNNHYPAEQYPRLRQALTDFRLTPGLERLQILSRLLLLLTELAAVYPGRLGELTVSDGLPAQLVSYVNSRLFEPISLEEISHRFSRSASQVSRVFRSATGTSLWEYVLLKRLLAARAMLQRGETAARAALECGFSDYSAFYRAYRKRFGHSPAADRAPL